MPTKKKVEVKPKKRVVKKVEVKKPKVVEKPKSKVVEAPVMPTFDNKRVLKILDDGRHTATHYHCDMEGGTKMHVPKKLFHGV